MLTVLEAIWHYLCHVYKLLTRYLNPGYYYYLSRRPHHRNQLEDPFYKKVVFHLGYSRASIQWVIDRGDDTWLLNHDLSSQNIVFDVGAYEGLWSQKIYNKYRSRLYVFEPVPSFHESIVKRFEGLPEVKTFNFGLADRNSTSHMGLLGMGSSIYAKSRQRVEVVLRNITDVLREQQLTSIDLIKINIEGGEYALLQKMLMDDLIPSCGTILIQFHEQYPSKRKARQFRKEIVDSLAFTHEPYFSYPFVWEGWVRKS